jgi:hypothetical protein
MPNNSLGSGSLVECAIAGFTVHHFCSILAVYEVKKLTQALMPPCLPLIGLKSKTLGFQLSSHILDVFPVPTLFFFYRTQL